MRLPTFLSAIADDRRGTSVIELAIAAPVLVLMIVGVADVGRGLSTTFTLNQALQRTLEKAAVSNQRSNFSYLKTEAANAAGVPAANVTVTAWLECDGVKKPNYNDSCASTEEITRYVEVAIDSSFTPMFGYSYRFMGASASADGSIPIQSKAALRVQ